MDLADLIRTMKGDRTYEQLATAAHGSPSRQRWQQIATTTLHAFPDAATIRTIARVLPASETTVVLAAAKSLGLGVRGDQPRLVQLLPPGVADLTDRQVAAVLAVVRELVPGDGETEGYELAARDRRGRRA